ncbi:MAG: hypothetical protein JWQ62_1199 [Lacunisphaera sp.]|nr:hypothetical protein [Lacunisphaera sp.]
MNRRDAAAAGGLAICFFALLLPLALRWVDPHHDGIMLKPAMDVLTGHVLFRDSFTQYGALTTYLQALMLAVQPTLLAVRVATVGCYAVTLFCLYAAWRLVLPRSLTIVAAVCFILFCPAYEIEPWNREPWLLLPWSSVYAMMFQAFGLYALFRVIRGEQPERWGLVLGVACAAAFWCRQPVGAMMAGSLFAIWPALHWTGWVPAQSSKRAILGRILAGYLAVNAVLVGGMALNGALWEWWVQNVLWPARWSQARVWMDTMAEFIDPLALWGMLAVAFALVLPGWVRRIRPNVPPVLGAVYYAGLAGLLLWQRERLLHMLAMREGGWSLLIPLIVIAFALVSIIGAVRQRGAIQPVEFYLSAAWAAFALGSLVQYYPMGDPWHMFYALGPVFGLFIFAAWRWSGRSAPLVAAGFAVLLLPAIIAKVRALPPVLNLPLVTLTKPAVLRGMKVPAAQARGLDQIADTLALVERFRPDVPAALIGNDALYLCFLRNQDNPIPYYVTWFGLASDADNGARWAYIRRTRPVLILEKARWEAVNDFYRLNRYLPILYLHDEDIEIAVPQELADAMGVKIYGLFGLGRAKVRL